MRYPKFLNKNDTIGICAPSAGVGNKIDEFNESIQVLRNNGYKIIETSSVRNDNVRSTSAKKRALELNELIVNKDVDMVLTATGGDYMLEIMPYINFENINNNPKWLMGYSDPTNLLFTVTTKLDIATLYGKNAGSYTLEETKWQKDNLDIISGNLVKQKSFNKYQDFIDSCNGLRVFDKKVKWICKKDKLNITGRLIGGCFEIIEKLLGTEYDYVSSFIEKYKDDGIIWYFDVFSDSSYQMYLALLQMKYAGYFKHCKAVLFGRVAFPKIEDKKLDYIKAADLALGNIPHINEMDIGHTKPNMTLINGSIATINYSNNKGSISFKLK